jgi:hypothetical protein
MLAPGTTPVAQSAGKFKRAGLCAPASTADGGNEKGELILLTA